MKDFEPKSLIKALPLLAMHRAEAKGIVGGADSVSVLPATVQKKDVQWS